MDIIKPKLPARELQKVFRYAEKHGLRIGLADYTSHVFYFYEPHGTELRVPFEEIVFELNEPRH